MEASHLNQEAAFAASVPKTPANTENAPSDSADAMQGNSGATLPLIVASWAKNGRDTVQIRLDRYQGNAVVDIRNWYPADDGTLKPAKGLTIGVKHLEVLAGGIADALAIARRTGLVQEGGDQ